MHITYKIWKVKDVYKTPVSMPATGWDFFFKDGAGLSDLCCLFTFSDIQNILL